MTAPQVLQCHVWLIDSEPPIWRSFAVSDQLRLSDLHRVLQIVMGWQFSHLYAFDIGRDRYAEPLPMPLEEALDATQVSLASFRFKPDMKFTYTYDFGDGWLHQITVADVISGAAPSALPQCLAGDRACPPEDSGGVWGYEELLERLSDPEDPDFEELLDWLGDFDPEAFAIADINQQLSQAFQ